ncbi:hypothetical protein [Roseovarius sp. ZX-A-9]|uniref:hypothetical protein n=1 Tax=Roseovarius sp. ZX-A-9 TaxID=3014783 RepID=UPI0023305E5B|nr:hypothetical protein [Roseovarius sp. ZX-A-9]
MILIITGAIDEGKADLGLDLNSGAVRQSLLMPFLTTLFSARAGLSPPINTPPLARLANRASCSI